MTGERWERQNFIDEDDAWNAGYLSTRWWQANESVGKCIACVPGRVFDDSTSWPESCTECPSGKYSAIEGGKHCNDCLRNTYASKGSTQCTTCDFGKTSGSNQQSCVPCNAWTVGSEHCDVPVMGLFIIFVSIFVLGGAVVILRRKYVWMFVERVISYIALKNIKSNVLSKTQTPTLEHTGTGKRVRN